MTSTLINKLPINIYNLLRKRTIESERIEYKAGWNPASVLHSLCAFANDFHNLGGGYVDSKTVLVLYAPGGETRPYKAKVGLSRNNQEWRYYIRKHSSNVHAKGQDELELLKLAATVPFDDRYCQTASLQDFSIRLIEQYLEDVGSDLALEAAELSVEVLGQRMNIIGGPSEALFPKNVGLLFFNDKPHKFFPVTQIDVVWFPDGPGGDYFEEKEFRGPLSIILRDAISYIERNYLKESVIKHSHKPEAERFWNFPIGAVEEALVNAVYHRSYEEREPVEVRITPEELLVLSFPGADRSIRMEDFQKGQAVSRRYRNRRVGEFLKELELAEGRSTGVPKILRAMSQNGSPAPVFESDENRTFFMVRLPAHEKVSLIAAKSGAEQVDSQGTPQDNSLEEKVNFAHTPQDAPQVTEHVERLIIAMTREKNRAELQKALRLKDRRNFIATYLEPALKAGLVEMTLPDKRTSKMQRYRRTVAGETLAQQIESKDTQK